MKNSQIKQIAVMISGSFNLIHKGHIEYFQNAKNHGDKLFVILHNDLKRKLKESEEFQDEKKGVLKLIV